LSTRQRRIELIELSSSRLKGIMRSEQPKIGMAKANTRAKSATESSKGVPFVQQVYAGRTDVKMRGNDQYVESDGSCFREDFFDFASAKVERQGASQRGIK